MKLGLGLIVVAAIISTASASPAMIREPVVDAGRQFATKDSAFTHGAGSIESGARLVPPPARFMEAPEKTPNSPYRPRPEVSREATSPQVLSESDFEELLSGLLYVTRPVGTTLTLPPLQPERLQRTAELFGADGRDPSSLALGEKLYGLAHELSRKTTISPERSREVGRALENYFHSHPRTFAAYTNKEALQMAKQERLIASTLGGVRRELSAYRQKFDLLNQFLETFYQYSPDETKLAIRKKMQQFAREREIEDSQLRQEALPRAEHYGASAHPKPLYGKTESYDPASLQKEASQENIYTRTGANPVMNAHSNNPSAARNGFQSTRASMSGENAPKYSNVQPAKNYYYEGHSGAVTGNQEATPLNNHEFASNGNEEPYDGNDGEDYADDDWDEELDPQAAGKEHELESTRHVPPGQAKNSDSKSVKNGDSGNRPGPTPQEHEKTTTTGSQHSAATAV